MSARYQVTTLGHTVRVVDTAEHEAWCAPDVCTVGTLRNEPADEVWNRAQLIAAALNAYEPAVVAP